MAAKADLPFILFAVAALPGLACGPGVGSEITSRGGQAVQLERRNTYYDVSLAPSGALGAAERATGTMMAPERGAGGAIVYTDDPSTEARFTCGVTFISPSYAITAAHCVDASDVIQDPDTQPITVQMYRLDAGLDWLPATTLSGSFPYFTHSTLTTGYDVDRYTCRLVARCGTAWGAQLNCNRPKGDAALIQCDGKPGLKYGYVNVAALDPPGVVVKMPWKHEIYSVPEGVVTDYWLHYTYAYYSGFQYKDNFHYFGNEKNQLLPLISTLWDPSDPSSERHKGDYDATREVTFTDLLGCHGTSGSGILQKNTWGQWDLLGPVSWWEHIGEELCQRQTGILPGDRGLAYAALSHSQYLWTLVDDCYSYDVGPYHSIHWGKDCYRQFTRILMEELRPWPWPSPCLTCPPFERFRWWDDPIVLVDPSTPVILPNTQFNSGGQYRVFIRTVAVDERPQVMDVLVGGELVATNVSPILERTASGELDPRRIGYVAFKFNARLDGPQDLAIIPTQRSGPFAIEEVTIAADGWVNTLDTLMERVGAGVQRVDSQSLILEPARFTSDGANGFAALLHPAERFILTRQAWVPGQLWSISFQTSAPPGIGAPNLFCGFVLADGAEIRAPCDPDGAGTASVRLLPPSAAEPVGFFVEPSAQVRSDVTIDNVSIQSWVP
jgi:hypothetical protein